MDYLDGDSPQGEDSNSSSDNRLDARQALEAKVAAKMATTFGDSTPNDDVEADVEGDAPDTDSADLNVAEVKEAATDEDHSTDNREVAETPAPVKSSGVPTLPESYRRSLHAYGLDDELIDLNLKNQGTTFLETAARLHEKRNRDTAAMAQLGRQYRTQQSQQGGEGDLPTPRTPQPAGRQPNTGIQPFNVKQLREEYGDDTLIDKVIPQVNAIIESHNAMLSDMRRNQQVMQQNQQAQLNRTIDDFFVGESKKGYEGLYGGTGQRNAGQEESRLRVMEMANDLVIAHQVQGRNISVEEAMTVAHDSVSSGFKQTAARATIQKAAKARNRGLTQKPSNRRTGGSNDNPETSRPRTRQELEARTLERMRRVFRGV